MRCCSGRTASTDGVVYDVEGHAVLVLFSLVGRVRDKSCVSRPIWVFTYTLGQSPLRGVIVTVVLFKKSLYGNWMASPLV